MHVTPLPPLSVTILVLADLEVTAHVYRTRRRTVIFLRAGMTRRQSRAELGPLVYDAELELIRRSFGEPSLDQGLPDHLDNHILAAGEITCRPGDVPRALIARLETA